MDKTHKTALVSMILNMVFCVYHIVLGIVTHSWWLFTIGIYYVILSFVRAAVLGNKDDHRASPKLVGIMLMILSLPLAGTVILSFIKDRGTVFHEIVMITIALYAFTKITLAIIKWMQSRQSSSAKVIILKNISLATAFVSIFSLQRSMLVSFGNMPENTIRIMNLATGSAVCIVVFLLGLNLLKSKKFRIKGKQ